MTNDVTRDPAADLIYEMQKLSPEQNTGGHRMKFLHGAIRQGDVALVCVGGDVPDGWEKVDTATLAYGEATGHHHSFGRFDRVTLFRPDDSMSLGGVVKVDAPATLVHQEHASLVVPAGLYIQAVQVEETPEATRIVVD